MIYEWPHPDLAPRVIDFSVMEQTRSAGESITGFEQVVYGVTQRWGLVLEFNNLKRHVILPYRALIASLRGRANLVRVPVFDAQLWPTNAALYSGFSDDTEFSDGSEFVTIDLSDIAASGDALANEIEIDFGGYGQILLVGQYFGLGDDVHIVTAIQWAGSVATVAFEPSLRRDHDGAPVSLRPTLLMRKVEDMGGVHPLEYGIKTSPTLALQEVLPDEVDVSEQ